VLVYTSVFFASGQSAIEGFIGYKHLVSGWGNPFLENGSDVAFVVIANFQPLFDSLPALFVQLFFTWRIWTFCRAVCGRTVRLLVAVICIFLVLTSITAFAFAITFVGLSLTPVDIPKATIAVIALVWTISTAVTDVTITVCMIFILYHAKSTAYFGETRDHVSRLLRLTIQTGFLTVIIALPIGPLYLRVQSGTIYALPLFLLGKSYVISLLANLNARSPRPSTTMKGDPAYATTTSHLPTMSFTPNRDFRSGEAGTISGGAPSSIRSVVHAVRHDVAGTANERASPVASESMSTNHYEGLPAVPTEMSSGYRDEEMYV